VAQLVERDHHQQHQDDAGPMLCQVKAKPLI